MTVELKSVKTPEHEPPKRRRNFNSEQKYDILQEWEECKDVKMICKKYDIHHTTLYRWKELFKAGKEHFLGPKNPKFDVKIKKMRDEINKLKDVVVSQAHEITLLKKSIK